MSVADQDPPSIPVGVHLPPAPLEDRSGQQLVQWLSAQADHMAGSLQQNVRALMVRASSPMPSSKRHKDEVARLRAQLHHSMRTNHDMRGVLQNQALATEQFQSRWQMAGQEAHAFVARARSESEDFVRTELGDIERFEDRVQRQYDGELRKHVHALQDERREHVGQEESKLRNELTHALTHDSQVCKDQEVLSHQEVAQLRSDEVLWQRNRKSFEVSITIVLNCSARAPRLRLSFRGKVLMKNTPCISILIMRSRRRTPRSTPCSMRFRACRKNNVFSWKQNDLRLSA